jgi:hypothetical protein
MRFIIYPENRKKQPLPGTSILFQKPKKEKPAMHRTNILALPVKQYLHLTIMPGLLGDYGRTLAGMALMGITSMLFTKSSAPSD